MKIDSPKSIFNPACAEEISIFSAHAGCALPGASGSLRDSSLSGQDFKPTIQAGGLAAYSPLGVPHPRRDESSSLNPDLDFFVILS